MLWVGGGVINGSDVLRINNSLDKADKQAALTPSKLKVTRLRWRNQPNNRNFRLSKQPNKWDHHRLLPSIICLLQTAFPKKVFQQISNIGGWGCGPDVGRQEFTTVGQFRFSHHSVQLYLVNRKPHVPGGLTPLPLWPKEKTGVGQFLQGQLSNFLASLAKISGVEFTHLTPLQKSNAQIQKSAQTKQSLQI